ncbi:MAG TPA: thioredoxin domain-containing protein [Planctomycetota bacterium]
MSLLQAIDQPTKPRETSDRALPALLARSAEPVVVASHFAGWETPWRALAEGDWAVLGRELGEGVRFAVLETGANRVLATRYGLEVIPAVLVFLRGEVVARFTGRVAPAQVIDAVRTALAQERERELDERELAEVAEPAPTVPSILRRRAAPVLAHAG